MFGVALRIGTSADYPPFSYVGNQDQLVGLDISLGTEFGQSIGCEVIFEKFAWPDLMPRLLRGDFDLVLSGINITDARKKVALFSSPYVVSGAIPVARNGLNVTSPEQINAPKIKLTVNKGGYLETVARRCFPMAQINLITDNKRLGEYLSSGQADVILTDSLELRSILMLNPTAVALSALTRDEHGVMFPKTSEQLRDSMNLYFEAIIRTGRMAELKRSFGVDS